MKLYRIAVSYKAPKCRNYKWIKGIVLAKDKDEAWKKFTDRVGEDRCNRGRSFIWEEDENEVYIYEQEF